MIGPGKYDDIATSVRNASEAEAVFVIILNGNKGSGFSVQMVNKPGLIEKLPEILRHIATTIEADLGK
jgi:hypothetical protein